jgi:hypothetical protein
MYARQLTACTTATHILKKASQTFDGRMKKKKDGRFDKLACTKSVEMKNSDKRKTSSVLADERLNSVAFTPRVNYSDRATATCRRSQCQLFGIEGVA